MSSCGLTFVGLLRSRCFERGRHRHHVYAMTGESGQPTRRPVYRWARCSHCCKAHISRVAPPGCIPGPAHVRQVNTAEGCRRFDPGQRQNGGTARPEGQGPRRDIGLPNADKVPPCTAGEPLIAEIASSSTLRISSDESLESSPADFRAARWRRLAPRRSGVFSDFMLRLRGLGIELFDTQHWASTAPSHRRHWPPTHSATANRSCSFTPTPQGNHGPFR